MSTSRTQTNTSSSTAGPSGFRRIPLTPAQPNPLEDEDLDEDEEEIIRKAEEKVRRVKERKAAAAAKQKAEEEAARKAKEEERAQAAAREERRKRMAEAATARSRWGTSPEENSGSPRRPVVEIRRERGKGKGKAKVQPVDEDPDDGGDGRDDDDNEDERAPCERCRNKKISCQMQAGKRSSIICKPCHDAKVKCSYSGRPSTVKREGGGQPTGERLAVLESQVAQLLADNRQLRDGQVKANTYHRHFNRKLDWLITDAARRRRTPPEIPEAGPSGLSRKRRRVMDSDEEEEQDREEGKVDEEDGEGEREEEIEEGEEEERDESTPKKARTEKGKERAE
ncbi:hypothetical protein F5876DRAFT_84854 [Lentinula aff. lateritia]|uniref:Uncharacterized protein n=1 Tax=Lentinula aff. lateritia TaxID=2804960 RepID=A0ACC1TFY1_9AGAR|nr:hypothetical protein F5876DRAFT_84854 [Lentinula aff. lateritia]